MTLAASRLISIWQQHLCAWLSKVSSLDWFRVMYLDQVHCRADYGIEVLLQSHAAVPNAQCSDSLILMVWKLCSHFAGQLQCSGLYAQADDITGTAIACKGVISEAGGRTMACCSDKHTGEHPRI